MIPTAVMRSGITSILPDVTFLEQNIDKVDGILITHAHDDHIGALPKLWYNLKVPIYATPFAVAMIHKRFSRAAFFAQKGQDNFVQPSALDIRTVALDDLHLRVGPFEVEWFRMNHSIPESCALVLRAPGAKTVFHTGDWKLDADPLIDPICDLDAMRRLGDEGSLALVGDSTNATRPERDKTEGEIRQNLISLFQQLDKERDGLIVVTSFSSNVARLESFAIAARAVGRKICVVGHAMEAGLQAMEECGYMSDAAQLISTNISMELMDRKDMVVVCTGCQGERMSALDRAAYGVHPQLTLEEGDSVVFSSSVIPGNGGTIKQLIKALEQRGVYVVQNSEQHRTHVTGHPSREEIIEVLGALRPQIVLPVHGEIHHQAEHAEIAEACGVSSTHIPTNGDVYRLEQDGAQLHTTISCNYTIVMNDGRLAVISKEDLFTKVKKPVPAIALMSVYLNASNGLQHPPTVSIQALRNMKVLDSDLNLHAEKTAEYLEQLIAAAPPSLQSDEVHTLRRYLIEEVNAFHIEQAGHEIPSYIHVHKAAE